MPAKVRKKMDKQQMKLGIFVFQHREVLKFCLENNISLRDFRHADILMRYDNYRRNGAKHRDAVNILMEDFGYKHTKTERLLSKFRKEV